MYSQSKHFRGQSARRPSYRASQKRTPRNNNRKQNIHPSRFVKTVHPETVTDIFVSKNKFADFEIHPLIKKNIQDKGFVLPSPIQDQTIPLGLAGKDIVGIADTGTGKTAAFAIPLLNKLIENFNAKAIIIAPTRELAQQIEAECRTIASGSRLKGALLIGGTSMSAQIRDLRLNPSVVIGTPGRMKDHEEKGNLKLSDFSIVVLDEVDRMIDMGFITDIRYLLGKLNPTHQSYFFSATLDPKLRELVASFLREDPSIVSIKTGETNNNVNQDIVQYSSPLDKIDKLHSVLINEGKKKALVFDDTKRSVERLSKELQERGFKADSIHGGRSQGQRQRALARFRQNEIDILVATDVAARGIDVIDITHVINYSTPNTYDDYVHRIGRAGRAGRAGQALTFVGN